MARSAARLCDAEDASIFRRNGDQLLIVAHHGSLRQGLVGEFSLPLTRGTANGRSVLDARSVHIADLLCEGIGYPEGNENARKFGHRTILAVPLLREGVAIGSIGLRRKTVQLFTEAQVALLETFADQAVIAIENARLLQAEQAQLRELAEALQQQTATANVVKVINRSPPQVQPVLDAIAETAAQLCQAEYAFIWKLEGGRFDLAAANNVAPEYVRWTADHPPGLDRGSATARAAVERATIHIPDVVADPEYNRRARRSCGSTVASSPFHCSAIVCRLVSLRWCAPRSSPSTTGRSSWSPPSPTRP
jgi:GAF domain